MSDAPLRCPAASAASRAGACREVLACGSDPGVVVPRDGVARAVILALRFVAAAAETGDAACWDAAFDRAEDAFGPRDGALLVARAGALLRALRRDGAAVRFLPPPCRRLSAGEAELLVALEARLGGERAGYGASPGTRAAFADLVAPLPTARCPVVMRGVPPAIGHPAVQPIL